MKIKIFLVFNVLCMLSFAGTSVVRAGSNAGAAFNAWPDTGQDRCYSNNAQLLQCPAEGEDFYGQDAQYQGPVRSYTKLGYLDGELLELDDNATVDDGWVMTRDNVTGLIWEIKGQSDKQENLDDPHDPDNSYAWCNTDEDENGGNQGDCIDAPMNTEEFINQLNESRYGDFSDWRMPTIKELTSLVNIKNVYDTDGDGEAEPAVDRKFFPGTQAEFYWSATTDMGDTGNAWYVCFNQRCVSENYPKHTTLRVRAVRGGQPVAAKRFIDNGDGTVTDTAASLMWQKCIMGQIYDDTTGECTGEPGYYSWKQALYECSSLLLAGFDDWRLPNRNELQSSIDYNSHAPAYDPSIFPNLFPEDADSCSSNFSPYTFWTSSTAFAFVSDFQVVPKSAFYVDFCLGTLCALDKSDWFGQLRVRAVRSIMANGDHDYDDDIDGSDLANMAYFSRFGNGFDPACDINHDNRIDSSDIEEFAVRFGKQVLTSPM